MAQNWVQHALERTGWQPRQQITGLIVLGVVIALVFGGVYLSQVATYATTNTEISALIAERDRLELENEDLRAQIARLHTVPRLLERAEALGFRPATAQDIEYLVIESYDPDRTDEVAPALVSSDEFQDTPQYDETFSGWVQQQVDVLSRQFRQFGR